VKKEIEGSHEKSVEEIRLMEKNENTALCYRRRKRQDKKELKC